LKGKSLKQRFVEKAEADGYVTEGVCIKTRRSLGTGKSGGFRAFKYDTLIVTYEYFVDGKRYLKKLKFQSPGMAFIEFPYKVAVYYSPNNPRKAVCKEEATVAHQQRNGCLLTIISTIITIKVVFEFLKSIGKIL